MIWPLTTPASLPLVFGFWFLWKWQSVRALPSPPFYQRFLLSLTNSYTYYNALVPSGNASCVPLRPSSCYVGLQEAWAWLSPSLDGGQVGGYIFPPEPPVPRKGLGSPTQGIPSNRKNFTADATAGAGQACRCVRGGAAVAPSRGPGFLGPGQTFAGGAWGALHPDLNPWAKGAPGLPGWLGLRCSSTCDHEVALCDRLLSGSWPGGAQRHRPPEPRVNELVSGFVMVNGAGRACVCSFLSIREGRTNL